MCPISLRELALVHSAINAKKPNNTYNTILEKLNNTDPGMGKRLEDAMRDGKVPDGGLGSLYYKISEADVAQIVHTNKGEMTVYLNENQLKDNEKFFKEVLYHEFKHIYFPNKNPYQYLKWNVLRDKNKDELKSCSTSCSAGPGHECDNPEDEYTCGKK
jgi:hypothetical protein